MANQAYEASREFQVLLFGDLSSTQFEEQLKHLLHVKTNPVLCSFFDRVGSGLRQYLGMLPTQQQELFPRFNTLIDLVSRVGETRGTPVIRFLLLSVAEIAQFIVHYGEKRLGYPPAAASCIIAPCTGGFAAAAVSCAQNLVDLVPLAVESVLTGFRTSLAAHLLGTFLSEEHAGPAEPWSAVVSLRDEDGDLEGMLRSYEGENTYPGGGAPLVWVSATTTTQVSTLTGRPSALHSFLTGKASKVKQRYLDIFSPFHAAHLFDDASVERIVSDISDENLASRRPLIPFLSSSTGEVMAAPNFKALLKTVVAETLQQPIRWASILLSCQKLVTGGLAQQCSILPFSSSAVSMVSSALQKGLDIPTSTEDTAAPRARLGPSASPSSVTGCYQHSKIAVVGYSGRFPSAASNDEFWELLRAGSDVHREIPADRFDWRAHYDASGKRKNTSRVKYGCFIDEPGVFDARFFNMSPREAENTDPAQRLVIMAAYEAMEMAGMVRNRTPSTQQDRVGVFFGTTSDDWREVNSGQNVDTYFIPGGNRAFVPGRISYFFRFSGPSLSIDTACSSSFAAIQAACSYLWRGDCDTAIAGGTNVLTNPDNFAGLDRGHFLSTTGNCNAFDDEANGYCRADAVGAVVLKRLDDALADADPIFGVIAGAATNHCGQTDSITRPHEGDQASVFRNVLRHAGHDPLDVGYVEMHGTGTQAGDAVEMHSVLSVFVPQRRPARPLYLGSAKANIGHAESASGVASLIKVLMMMKHNEIPPHCGIKTRINRNYPSDLAERGVRIALTPTPWPRTSAASGTRSVFLNNFSAAGGNTAILLEDGPLCSGRSEGVREQTDPRPVHLVAVTAKTPKALADNIARLVSWLEKSGRDVALPALAYTTTARRMHHNHRVVACGSDMDAIVASLRSIGARNPPAVRPVPARTPRVVFVFTGQGSLYAGLGASLFRSDALFRADILRLDDLAQRYGFPSFVSLIDGSEPADAVNDNVVAAHLALVCVQIGLSHRWTAWGVAPAAAVGHSLGEYAALHAAGVLSAADAVYLVGTRAALLRRRCEPGTHAMLALKTQRDGVAALMGEPGAEGVELACVNHPGAHVVAGPTHAIETVAQAAARAGIESVRLEVPFAFHSAQVDAVSREFGEAAAAGGVGQVAYRAPRVPYLSPLLGRVVAAGEEGTLDGAYLARASRGLVNFLGALEAGAAHGYQETNTIWLEIGAHPLCGAMVKGTLGPGCSTLATLRRGVDAYKMVTAAVEALYLGGVAVDWNEYHRPFPASHAVVGLPTYAWDLKNYWIQYRNNFCLTKGEGDGTETQQLPPPPPVKPKSLSPAVQHVVEEQHGAQESTLVAESDIFDHQLLPILQGHLVNGAALCPSSLYADIALTVASYLLRGPGLPVATTGLDVADVRAENPLIAQPGATTHRFRISAVADWPDGTIALSIFSVDSAGKRTVVHASLVVRVVPQQRWLAEWRRHAHLIAARIEALDDAAVRPGGSANHIRRGMAYKLFGALVSYEPAYRGMEEVVLHSAKLEAVSTVRFQVDSYHRRDQDPDPDAAGGVDPRWIDSLGHIAGFIMNANDAVDSRAHVFINHGWERMRIAEPLSADKTYRAYNRMQLVEKTTYAGDTYILEGGRIVAIFEGVTFQGIPRQLLDRLLPNKSITSPQRAKPAQVPSSYSSSGNIPTTRPSAAAAKPLPKPDNFGRVLTVISQEVGVPISELTSDTTALADLGVDSLLSLTITSRLRDELDIDLPSSCFLEVPTIRELKALMMSGRHGAAADQEAAASDASASSSSSAGGSRSSSSSRRSNSSETSADEHGGAEEGMAVQRASVVAAVREILAQETGVGLDELAPSTHLADIGADSLMGLTISDRLTERLDVSIQGSLFLEHESLGDLEDAVCAMLGLDATAVAVCGDGSCPPSRASPGSESEVATPASSSAGSAVVTRTADTSAGDMVPRATSVLLAGSRRRPAELVIFLFPDGSGSASSYAALAPAMHDAYGSQSDHGGARGGMAVYGLNCPWRKAGEEMTRLGMSMEPMVARYLVEIRQVLRSHASSSPAVVLGGWSAGGILAFEAARQLAADGAVAVRRLVLLDSPNPIGLQNPPARMYDFFDSLGIFGDGTPGKTPDWLRRHFDAFLRVLDAYEPAPLPPHAAPSSVIVYARDGILSSLGPDAPRMAIRPDDPREMVWLLNDRTDFSAAGWKSLLGPAGLHVSVVDGVNHFSMMDAGEKMKEIGRVVAEFLRSDC